MKTITTGALLNMSIEPIKQVISRWLLDREIRACDRDMEVSQRDIENAYKVIAERTKDRINLVNRRAGI